MEDKIFISCDPGVGLDKGAIIVMKHENGHSEIIHSSLHEMQPHRDEKEKEFKKLVEKLAKEYEAVPLPPVTWGKPRISHKPESTIELMYKSIGHLPDFLKMNDEVRPMSAEEVALIWPKYNSKEQRGVYIENLKKGMSTEEFQKLYCGDFSDEDKVNPDIIKEPPIGDPHKALKDALKDQEDGNKKINRPSGIGK